MAPRDAGKVAWKRQLADAAERRRHSINALFYLLMDRPRRSIRARAAPGVRTLHSRPSASQENAVVVLYEHQKGIWTGTRDSPHYFSTQVFDHI